MPAIRSNVGSKWARVTALRGSDYQEGVNNPRTDWQQATLAGAKNQAEGVQKAIAEKRFEKGVQKAGTSKWSKGVTGKGVARFGQGVQEGQSSYESGISPYLQVIEQTSLPPRYPKGDPRNLERVKVMSDALRKKKLSL